MRRPLIAINEWVRKYIGDTDNPPLKYENVTRVIFVYEAEAPQGGSSAIKETIVETFYVNGTVPENLSELFEDFCVNELPKIGEGFDDYWIQSKFFMENIQPGKPWGSELIDEFDFDLVVVVAEMKIICRHEIISG